MRVFCFILLCALSVTAAASADSQPPAQTSLTFADLADLALAAPVAVHVRVADSVALREKRAATAPPGLIRFYVEADVVALIRSPGGMPSSVTYLVDLPRDAKGKAPKLREGSELILFARPVNGRPGELRLVSPDAQIPFSAARAEQLRAILTEAAGSSPPPRISGIGRAFHVPGAITGESESQIFLLTADGRPVSLTVLRRPGQTPQWAVALSEIVDDAAKPPARDTLLWYRLACALPRALPRQSLAEAEPQHIAAIQDDYRFILQQLGFCARSRR